MRRIAFICICAFMLVVSACAAPLREAVISDPGPYPDNYREIIRLYLREAVQNPETIRDFEILKPPEIYTLDSYFPIIPLYRGQQVWEVFIVFDVKLETGVYRGRDMHVAWIRYGKLVAYDYEEIEFEFRIQQRLRKS